MRFRPASSFLRSFPLKRLGFSPSASSREQEVVHGTRLLIFHLCLRDILHYIVVEEDRHLDLLNFPLSGYKILVDRERRMPSSSSSLLSLSWTLSYLLTFLFWRPFFSITLWRYARPALLPRESFRLASLLLWLTVSVFSSFYLELIVYPWLDVQSLPMDDGDDDCLDNDLFSSDSLSSHNALVDHNDDDNDPGDPTYPFHFDELWKSSLHNFYATLAWIGILLFNWRSLGDSLRSLNDRGVLDVSNPDALWFFDEDTETTYLVEYTFFNSFLALTVATSFFNWFDLFLLLESITLFSMATRQRRFSLSSVLKHPVYHVGESFLWVFLLIYLCIGMSLPSPFFFE